MAHLPNRAIESRNPAERWWLGRPNTGRCVEITSAVSEDSAMRADFSAEDTPVNGEPDYDRGNPCPLRSDL